MRKAPGPPHPGNRTHIQDYAPLARHHHPRGRLASKEDGFHVDVDHPLKHRLVASRIGSFFRMPVVDHDVEATPALGLGHNRLNLRNSVTSQRTNRARPGVSASIIATVGTPPSRGVSVRSATITRAPSRAKAHAIARPFPLAPPVTMATRPSSSIPPLHRRDQPPKPPAARRFQPAHHRGLALSPNISMASDHSARPHMNPRTARPIPAPAAATPRTGQTAPPPTERRPAAHAPRRSHCGRRQRLVAAALRRAETGDEIKVDRDLDLECGHAKAGSEKVSTARRTRSGLIAAKPAVPGGWAG